ncbi:MAG: DNA translocase FtsK 4TM domain-containing protein [Tissierellia bacterium]|nr:DNA translocase FtsK 4TM domain-containing protein [Tissierellia bacterium]
MLKNKKKKPKKFNKRAKSRTKEFDSSSKDEIFGLLLMVIGIISFISLYSDKMGIIGQLLYKLLSLIGGSANFLLPLMLIFWGMLYNMRSTQNYVKKYIISSIIIYLCILVFLDESKDLSITLIDRINLAIEYLSITKSGGVIGAILGFFIYKLLGSLGTYILMSIVILATLYFMLKDNISDIKLFVENLVSHFIEIKEKFELKRMTRQKDRENKKRKSSPIKKSKEQAPKTLVKNDEIRSTKDQDLIIHDFRKIGQSSDDKEDQEEKHIQNDHVEESFHISEEKKMMNYIFPKLELLNNIKSQNTMSNQEIINNGKIIEHTIDNFGIESKVVAINKGPVITCYELEPAPGVRLSKIVSLSDNIAMALASSDIRIEAPIPGKAAVGIEVPNKVKDAVSLREILESKEFKKEKSSVPLSLGKDVEGNIIISSLEDMPHLLIAGATGSGKSVCINGIILNIIFKSTPSEVKLMLIDPKVVELSVYNGIPHLLIPVVTNPKKASFALNWAVEEMEKRYQLFAENSVRDLKGYNHKMKEIKAFDKVLPKIVIIVDELADLMMVASNEVEDAITRLAQMARAAGMHLILATQRPSVDVITGTIKANIPSRIAFSVSSSVDSRTILDLSGAEKLLGKGDMLFYPGSYPKPKRIQGAFVSDKEVEQVVDFIKLNNDSPENKMKDKIIEEIEKQTKTEVEDRDPLFKEALRHIVDDEQASISYLQRKLRIGYSRAARIVDQMEEMQIIGPHEGSKPRSLLMTKEKIEELLEEDNE